MTLFTQRKMRSLGRARRKQLDAPENELTPNLNLQTLQKQPQQLGSEQVLELQRVVGNSATQRMLGGGGLPGNSIQRMPTAQVVESTLGKPKKDTKKVFGGVKLQSTKYKAVLAALRAFEGYTVTTYLAQDASGLRAQMTAVNRHLQTIYAAMNAYQGKKGKKAIYMLGHLGEVKTFQNLAARAFLNKMDNPGSGHVYLASSLSSFLNKALREGSQPPLRLDSNNQVGSESGGSKTVDKYNMGGNREGYFSDKKNTLNNIDPGDKEGWESLRAQVRQEVETEARTKGWSEKEIKEITATRMNGKMNEFYLGTGQGSLGIDANDARMNNRDIAMSRLDQLLGTHLIARAQLAVVHMPDGSKREGSIMEGAKGESPNKSMSESDKQGGSSKQEVIQNRQDRVGFTDPELMRQLSRLQLIDIIASQVDRNTGNYFILRDKDGKLVGITGIDNDFAFGTNTDPDMRKQEMLGISRYVDKELAETIIALDPSLLEPILSDLLPEREVQAAITRLTKLQAELQSTLTNLLEPDEWTAHAQDILNEKKSYFYNLDYKLGDTRGVNIG